MIYLDIDSMTSQYNMPSSAIDIIVFLVDMFMLKSRIQYSVVINVNVCTLLAFLFP